MEASMVMRYVAHIFFGTTQMWGPAVGLKMSLSHAIETLSHHTTLRRVVVVLSTPSASLFAPSGMFVRPVVNRLEPFYNHVTGEVVTSHHFS
jgi:hypothetical protein